MKTIAVQCPGCGRDLELNDEHAPRPVRCATCGTPVRAPAGKVVAAWPVAPLVADVASVATSPRRSRLLRVLLAGLLGGVVLGSVVFGVLWAPYFAPSNFDADLPYLPDDCDFFVSMQVSQVAGSDARVEFASRQESIQEKPPEGIAEFGLTNEDIRRLTVGGRLEQLREDRVAVVHTTRPVELEAVWDAWHESNYTRTPVGKYTLTVNEKNGRAVAAPEGNVLVYGSAERLRAILSRDRNALLSPGMKALLQQADFTQSVVNVVNLENQKPNPLSRPPISPTHWTQIAARPAPIQQMNDFLASLSKARTTPVILDNYLGLPHWDPFGDLYQGHELDRSWQAPRGLVQQVRITWDIEVTLTLHYANDEDAEALEQSLNGYLENRLNSGPFNQLTTLNVTARGEDLVLDYRYRPISYRMNQYNNGPKLPGNVRIGPPQGMAPVRPGLAPPGPPPVGPGVPQFQGGPAGPPGVDGPVR